MTRARDLMVLARSSRQLSGEWLEGVDSPWLLPKAGASGITLPRGESIAAECWTLSPPEEPVSDTARAAYPLHWFLPGTSVPLRPALNFTPSGGEPEPGRVLEKCRVGERIPVREGADMNALGTAIHACLALSFTASAAPIEVDEIERLLRGYEVADCLSATHVLQQARALHDWIARRWPNARAFAEHPVQSILDSGQVLNGRLDLLLDAPEGWILIDHKASQLAPAHWDQLANEHGRQLGAYAEAIYRASGRKVVEKWLFLPVAAGCVRVG
jgi:ATP-dependent helicase/nuclease subunit A